MKDRGLNTIQRLLSGEILQSNKLKEQRGELLLIAVLTFIYILGGYHTMQQQHHLSDLKKEVKDVKFEYLTVSAERSELTRQSQVVKDLRERESLLLENKTPVMELYGR